MARVFTGRVVIPGDKIDQYFAALEAAEIEREPFKQLLEKLNQEFANFLAAKYVAKTVRKHTGISDLRVALKKFFQFLATEKGIINQKVLDALK